MPFDMPARVRLVVEAGRDRDLSGRLPIEQQPSGAAVAGRVGVAY
ncbi:hypothetical protein [Streptomyces halobius]